MISLRSLALYKPECLAHSTSRHRAAPLGGIRRFFVFAISLNLCLGLSFAADKNGVSPNTISVPKGPGAIEGLGESFQPHLNTGTASSSLSLKLPPGTAGRAPSLSLSYEGGAGNGPLGFGWMLPVAFIQRRSDEGIPTYGESVGIARSDTLINELKEELVPLTNGFLFCKNEGAFIRYQQVSNSWVGTLPGGTKMEFGLTPDACILDLANTNHVFSWLLQKETDTHGNVLVYGYTNFPGPNNLNQKYLSSIAYGPGAPPWANFHFVTFTYEDRPDWFEDCRAGFIVRTGKRLKQILIGTQGPTLTNHLAGDFNGDGQTDYLDRKYVLDYLNYAGTNSHWSLLAKVTLVGADGASSLPPATYGYVVSDPPDLLSASGKIIGGSNEPPVVMDNPLVEFLDLNGDGLPDVLVTDPGGGPHTAYVNGGQVASASGPVINWQGPAQVDSEDGRAWQFDLQSTAPIAHLADMDGDGLADLAVTALDGSVLYFPNRGRLLWGARQDMSIQDTAPPSPFGSPDVRTADLDFDKRMDIIQSISTGNGADYRIWFNLGNQTYSASVTVPQDAGVMFSTPGVQIADFNGDRLPDIARIQPAVVTVTAGLGYGRFAAPVTVPIPDLVLDDTQVARAALMDINGDGLADLVLEQAAPGELWYWLNLGNYTFSHRKVVTDMPTGVGANAVVRWADINGNGTTDLIYADSTSTPRMQAVDIGQLLNDGATPNILVAISNGIGRVTTISYLPSTIFSLQDASAGHPWPDLMPNPVQVVAAITDSDSLGHQYVTQFRYHNGYYDPVEKQFRGFAAAEQIDLGDASAPTLVTRSFFDTGRTYEPMKGKLLALSVEQEDGSVFSVQTNSWTLPPVTLYTGTNGTNVAYAHPTGTVKIISELGQGTPRRLESESVFDNYGNQTTNADYGIVENGDRTAFNDERITTIEYALNTNAWLLRHPARQEIKDLSGNVISRVESYYDDETFSGNNFGLLSIGNLTLTRAWINPSNSAAYVKAARTKYDTYGNPIILLDPLASAPGGAADFSQGHAREITYDSRFHAYPITEAIHLGNSSQDLIFQTTYDQGFASVTSSIDFNTNTTTYAYDGFARLINIVRPYDTPAYPTAEYDYAVAVPYGVAGLVNYVETRQLDKTPGSAATKRDHYLIRRAFTDGLGRTLMTKQEAEPAAGGSAPRVVVGGAVLFNARQKPSRTLNPYFSLQSGTTLDDLLGYESIEDPAWTGTFHQDGQLVNLGLAAAHQTAASYDATLRPIATTNQDGSFHYSVYEPLLTRNYDENQADAASTFHNNAMVQYNDGLGRLIRSDQITALTDDGTPAGSKRSWTSQFEYDLNDDLTRITDAQNNVKLLQYDGLKRKTSMNDPDRGTTSYIYDDASNLRETVDAKGQHIKREYDGANRLLTETYVGSPLSPRLGEDRGEGAVNVAYHYDAPAGAVDNGDGTKTMAQNTRGMLSFVSDGAGEEHTSYDARGRAQYVIKRIPDPILLSTPNSQPSEVLVSFRTSFDYDSLDRVTRMIYPDNDQVTYSYNERGLLERIPGGPGGSILSNLVYAPSGQQQQVSFGNGVRTTYGYDPRLRLHSLLTYHISRVTDPLIEFSYAFDAISNLKTIADQRPTSSLATTDPRRNTQVFAYDDLYRLTRVQYNLPNPSSSNGGEIDYRYDRIGNMLSQTSDIQQFENGFSVTQLGDMSYGGSAGASGRTGRAPADPPGPHALSSVSQLSTNNSQPRVYGYDANGNMTVIDGLTNTWDFKDRLVAVQDAVVRADYNYDASGRRIIKVVTYQAARTNDTCGVRQSTTLYVNDCFEVRNHDTPEKFVFNGDSRVAHVVGSLSQNLRVQRLRLWPGWNLCSLAVTASNALAQFANATPFAAVTAIYRWNASSSNYLSVVAGETLPAGTVLWVNALTNATLSLIGQYSEPLQFTLGPGNNFIGSAGLELWCVSNLFPASASAMRWVPPTRAWEVRFGVPLDAISRPPMFIAPGEAIFVKTAASAQLAPPPSELRIRYYHPDHLGSCSVITDASGGLVEETAFYPFGAVRNEYRLQSVHEPYRFSQKERDPESGLHYFGKRFYHSILGKWLSTDPMEEKGGGLNLYAYANQNPMKFYDPNGGEVEIATTKKGGKITHYKISVSAVLVNQSKLLDDKGFTKEDLEAFARSLEKKANKRFTGSEGGVSWEMDLKIQVVEKGADTGKNHVFFLRDPTRKTSGGGEAVIGGTHMTIMAYNLTQHRPAEEERDDYARTYKSPEGVGEHELGHDLGLPHLEDIKQIRTAADRENVMYSHREWDAQKISKAQIEHVYEMYSKGLLNKYDQ